MAHFENKYRPRYAVQSVEQIGASAVFVIGTPDGGQRTGRRSRDTQCRLLDVKYTRLCLVRINGPSLAVKDAVNLQLVMYVHAQSIVAIRRALIIKCIV